MSNHLRIAHIFASDPKLAGGTQNHVYNLTQALVKRGHDVKVFGCGYPPFYAFPKYQSLGGTFQVPTPTGNWACFSYAKIDIRRFFGRNDELFDICHVHEPYALLLNWQILLRVKNALPVVTFHVAWDQWKGNILLPLLPVFRHLFSTHVKLAIFVSRAQQRQWQGVIDERVTQAVIPHAVDHMIYKPQMRKQNAAIQLLFLARLIKRKGLLDLINALRRLDKKTLALTYLNIVGDGPDKKKSEKIIDSNGLSSHVKFWGQVAEEVKMRLYQTADIFCVPHVDEAFGITLLEAMACGVPIIGYQNAAFREILHDYPSPELLVRPQDISALVQAIKRMVVDKSLRKSLSTWCVKESQKYNWDNVAKVTDAVYRELL